MNGKQRNFQRAKRAEPEKTEDDSSQDNSSHLLEEVLPA